MKAIIVVIIAMLLFGCYESIQGGGYEGGHFRGPSREHQTVPIPNGMRERASSNDGMHLQYGYGVTTGRFGLGIGSGGFNFFSFDSGMWD